MILKSSVCVELRVIGVMLLIYRKFPEYGSKSGYLTDETNREEKLLEPNKPSERGSP
jgi:hypothetical protein